MNVQKAIDETRGTYANTEALLAYKEGAVPVVLALGQGLGATTRSGQVLAWLLSSPYGEGGWVIVARRPARTPALKREIEAAERIAAAGRLVDVAIEAIVLSHGGNVTKLVEQAKENAA